MKKVKLYFVLSLVLLQFANVNAQTKDNKFAIGLNYLKNEYNGDYGSGIFDFSRFYSGGGLSLAAYLNRSFDLGLQGSFGNYGYYVDQINHFAGNKFDASLFGHYKFNNGYILPEDAKWAPFLSLGVGFAKYSLSNNASPYPTIIVDKPDFVVPVGLGIKYQLTKTIAFQYQYLYNFTNSDVHDQNRSGGVVNTVFGTSAYNKIKSGNDAFGEHLIGIVISFGKSKDSDHDGVADKNDLCADTPAGVKVDAKGCPVDTDGDGVPDYLDKCPDVAGVAKFDGCPDSDNDGVQDSEDQCPNTPAGVKVDAKGCPIDTDGDGIPDYLDKCNDTPAGVKVDANGCPIDTDGDGVPDYLDKCPTVAGTDGNGCPTEKKAETKPTAIPALANIQFASGKYEVESSNVLDKAASVLKSNPSYKIDLSGYADNQGPDDMNLELSKERANAVKNYLVKKGISADRINVNAYGEENPVADNATATGRTQNRRVELKLIQK